MSSEFTIKVKNLGKCYQIYNTPRDRLKQFLVPRLKKIVKKPANNYFREFWALRNIDFEINKGDTIGIIGRNGSGKSTLLQLICNTLTPTTGEITVRGKVAALLELGAGFNPEFTGRENVFMASALYGLDRETVEARLSKIFEFADIGEFIDQPVKTYSSGMYVRLAFSVIAHVDADVLVVDEALAVGDAIFTQKCMRFIREFQQNGTLIFVSHDTASVINLCKKAIWLDQGKIQKIGDSRSVAEAYLQFTLQKTYGNDVSLKNLSEQPVHEIPPPDEVVPILNYESQATANSNMNSAKGWKTGSAEIVQVQLEKVVPDGVESYAGGERVRMTIRAHVIEPLDKPILGFLVRDRLGQDLFGENTLPFTELQPTPAQANQELIGSFVFRLPMLPNGQYLVMASIANGDLYNNVQHHWLHDALIINVSSSKVRWGLVGLSFEDVTLAIQQ